MTDDQLAGMLDTGELIDSTDQLAVPAAFFDHDTWDSERTGPKSLEEARSALADRVRDPAAPDTDATAYDSMGS